MSDNLFYGWYDDPTQKEPTYEPHWSAPCPICGKTIDSLDDLRTHNLMYTGGYAERSYFYRTHKTCDEKFPMAGDEFIFKLIERNGD